MAWRDKDRKQKMWERKMGVGVGWEEGVGRGQACGGERGREHQRKGKDHEGRSGGLSSAGDPTVKFKQYQQIFLLPKYCSPQGVVGLCLIQNSCPTLQCQMAEK